jgi:hypothetical protein
MLVVEDMDRRPIAELELQQPRYDASLAVRRYAPRGSVRFRTVSLRSRQKPVPTN